MISGLFNIAVNKKEALSMKLKHLFFVLISFVFIFSPLSAEVKKQDKAKYVFFFIGDGMGIAEVNATEAYLMAKKGKVGVEHLEFSKFPNVSLVTTYAVDRYITDSAAAGTALSTGNKTSVETVGMDRYGKKKFVNMAELAKKAGMKVGVISTVNINDATPSSFYGHQPHRKMHKELAQDLLNSGYEFFGGGGIKNADITAQLREKGYIVTNTKKDFNRLSSKDKMVYAMCPKLDKDMACRFSIEQDSSEISLRQLVSKAVDVLDNPNGFFIMAEAGKIDWANHANDVSSAVKDVLALNDAVSEALKFYKKHPDETLIVVTSDHETGGFAIGTAKMEYNTNLKLITDKERAAESGIAWTTNAHTGMPVAAFAIGKGSDKFRGYIDNTDVAKNIMFAMGVR